MAGDTVAVVDQDFDKVVLKSSEPVLVDFWATWCPPCKAIAPYIEELATQYKGKVKFAKVDVDEAQMTAQNYGIRSIPTMILFKKGQEAARVSGAMDARSIGTWLQRQLG